MILPVHHSSISRHSKYEPQVCSVHDVTFPEATAVGNSCPPEPPDDDSESVSTTTQELSDDEMCTDGDSIADTKDVEQPREPMRSEGSFLLVMSCLFCKVLKDLCAGDHWWCQVTGKRTHPVCDQ